jgi:3-methyladenine DNA glycosylase AlkD
MKLRENSKSLKNDKEEESDFIESISRKAYLAAMDLVINNKLSITQRDVYRNGYYDGWKACEEQLKENNNGI